PTFITSIKDNKKLRGKTAFCIKIYVKLMDVGYRHITIKLIFSYPPKLKFSFSTDSYSEKPLIFSFWGHFFFLS
ncbi:hypothetical protein, partial [Bacillus cereus]|uniref:hypothetical protein n=1 Tax=Bacillus cereus TaxID=1396 RepID=UPI0005394B87